MSGRLAAVFAGLLALFVAGAAPAQNRTGGAPGQFDFYVLALSWSSGFCDTDNSGRQRNQCDIGAGLGFVVHGLWPQFERGFPTECSMSGAFPSRMALEQAKGLFPDEGLARYEWRKHGVCSGKSPTDYFADVRRARAAVKIPPQFERPDEEQNWTPLDIERAFAAANPGLRPDMMAIGCKRGVLQEVRICMTRDLRNFQTCEEVNRGGCRGRPVRVPPVR